MLWTLTGGDITKVPAVENTDVRLCYDWYYNLKVKELNEIRAAIKRIKEAKES